MEEQSEVNKASLKRKYPYVDTELIEATKPAIRSEDEDQIRQICSSLHLSNDEAHIVQQRMRLAIEQGLSKEKHDKSSIKCFPTYVRHLPTGMELGRYLALDLGGTNFRVLLVELFGSKDQKPAIVCRKFPVPENVRVSSGNTLFEYIANSIASFLKEHGLQDECLPIAFTFSFPCEQTGLDSARLSKWTKGFNCPDITGKDICQCLKDALAKRDDVKVNLTALLNDSTGCLLSCAWKDPRCRIGLIVGTGCNACYLENLNEVQLWDGEKGAGPQTVIINTEWGAFGENGELDFILTKWDEAVDAGSINPGQHIYEKMISGMYMGEVVRHVLLELAEKSLAFSSIDWSRMKTPGAFETRHACEVEHDPIGSFDRCRNALKEVFGHDAVVETSDCYTVRFVCEEVSRRACMLLAAGIAGLLRKMDYKDVVVAVDGTLFRRHPLFNSIMKKKITQLMGIEYQFDVVQSEDGSGLGAAIIAAVMSVEAKKGAAPATSSTLTKEDLDSD